LKKYLEDMRNSNCYALESYVHRLLMLARILVLVKFKDVPSCNDFSLSTKN